MSCKSQLLILFLIKFNLKNLLIKIVLYIKRRIEELENKDGNQLQWSYLDDWVGVLAADVLRPSNDARCPSNASNNELGALVKSGISPLSIPTF